MDQPPATTPQAAPSPGLEQIDPAALNELFNRDPLKLSDADVDQMILYFRSERARFQESEATGKPQRKVAGKAAPKALPAAAAAGLSLDDLQL